MKLHRAYLHGTFSAWTAADVPLMFLRPKHQPGSWKILVTGDSPATTEWLSRHGLRGEEFNTLGEAVRTVQALRSAFPVDPGSSPRLRMRRHAANVWRSHDGQWEIGRFPSSVSGVYHWQLGGLTDQANQILVETQDRWAQSDTLLDASLRLGEEIAAAKIRMGLSDE